MKRMACAIFFGALLAACLSPVQAAEQETLYKKLGGYDAIAAVVDDFLGRLANDEKLGRFFVGHGTESIKQIRQHIVNQLVEAAGGPAHYTGRTMKQTHAGLKITAKDWEGMMKHLKDTLEKFKVPEAESKAVTDLIGSMEKDIVEEKK